MEHLGGEEAGSKHCTSQCDDPPNEKGGCGEEGEEVPRGEHATAESGVGQKLHGTVLEEGRDPQAGRQDGQNVSEVELAMAATRDRVEFILLEAPDPDDATDGGEDDGGQVEDL